MRVLITGGKGFVGKYLVKMMDSLDWEVIVLDSDVSNLFLSPEVWQYLFGKPIDAIVHLAAKLMINGHTAKEYFDVNTIGTYNMLELCRLLKVKKFIYAMTHSDTNRYSAAKIDNYGCQEYGTSSWSHNSIPFIQSKVAAADMVEVYTKQKIVQGIILRLANIRGYGSADTKYNSPFHQFIDKARKGEDIEIWGNPPSTKRDMIYVKDVCRAFIAAIESKNAKGYYNVGSGIGLTIEDEVKAIIRVFSPYEKMPEICLDPMQPERVRNKQSKIIYCPDKEEIRKQSCIFNIRETEVDLNWVPIYTYEQGLEDFKKEAGW